MASNSTICELQPGSNRFTQYGGVTGKAATDWGVYGFGLPAFNKVLKAAAQATKDNGLIMDFCMGPQSGQGVPAKPDNPGLSYELVRLLSGI